MPLSIAWETFGQANGVISYSDMIRRVGNLRRDEGIDDSVGWVVLSDVMLLDRADWIAALKDWSRNIVRVAGARFSGEISDSPPPTDSPCCFYCERELHEGIKIHVDHVIPWSLLSDPLWDLVRHILVAQRLPCRLVSQVRSCRATKSIDFTTQR